MNLEQLLDTVPSYAKDLKRPSLNTVAPMSLELTDATGSGSDVVRVALRKAA